MIVNITALDIACCLFWVALFSLIAFAAALVIARLMDKKKTGKSCSKNNDMTRCFSISEYLQRREKFILSLEEERRVKYTIVLWWGYDGLRLNNDGSWGWISRKPPEPQPVGYNEITYIRGQTTRSPIYSVSDMCQSTQAQISALQAQNTVLQLQAAQHAQNMAMMAAVMPLYPTYSDFRQGLVAGTFPLTGCCCNQTILR